MRIFALALTLVLATAAQADIWVNEIHYDNVAGDTGEFVEIFVTTDETTAASDIFVDLINGSGGAVYGSASLGDAGVTSTSVSGGTIYLIDIADFGTSGIQNGTPDGVGVIVDIDGDGVFDSGDGDAVIQFLTYEGAFSTTDAFYTAEGTTLGTDIGVSESSSTPVGASLHLIGTGSSFSDFSWAVTTDDSPGALNTGQTVVPEPSSWALMGLVLLGLGIRRRKTAA